MVTESNRLDPHSDEDTPPAQDNSVDDVWKQAATLRDVLRDEETRTQRRRTEAEAARRAAEEQVLDATREVCEQIRGRAEQELRAAEEARNEAERVLTSASTQAQQLKAEADAKLKSAREAQERVEAAIIEAQREANDIRDRMRRQAADEIRDMLQDIEALRSAAQQELETQRIVTETARIRAVSPIEVNIPEVGPLNLVGSGQLLAEPAPPSTDVHADSGVEAEQTASPKRKTRGKSAA